MANGTLKVSNIETSSGSGTITLGQSGETINIPSGATVSGAGAMTPAFEAYLGGSGGQSVSDNTLTLVQANTEVYDTDSAYDTSTYRFTPQTAGKYFVYGSIQYEAGSNDDLIEDYLYFKLNGSNILETQTDFSNVKIRLHHVTGSMVVDMNGSSDYVELYARINTSSGSGQLLESDSQYKRATHFGAYRIIGA
jgi:hypothetical protein